MIIKKPKKSDAKELTRLYCSIWTKEIPKRVKDYFTNKIDNKEIFIAVEKNVIVGIISFTKGWWRGADYIDEVVVDKYYRGKGIAKRLIIILEQDAKKRKVRRIFSSTQPSNKISIKMQQKLKYKKCGYIDNMFEEEKREIIFSKKI